MFEVFIVKALLAGIGIALISGPLGCFIVWRRMAYFGATLAHSALLGVAVCLMFDVAPLIGVLGVCAAMVPLLLWLQRDVTLASDTVLGLLAHATLAVGLILFAFIPEVRADILGYLFGDILTVTTFDIWAIYVGGALVLGVLCFLWRSLLAGTVSQELAAVEGQRPNTVSLIFMLLIAILIAVAMKVVGVLLIVSLLIIPPATARLFSHSPEGMAALASGFGVVSVGVGLGSALAFDTPGGASIVVAALVLFLAGLFRVRVFGGLRRLC